MTSSHVEDRLRRALDELTATTTARSDAWADISTATPRRARHRGSGLAAAATALALLLGGVALGAILMDRTGSDRRIVGGTRKERLRGLVEVGGVQYNVGPEDAAHPVWSIYARRNVDGNLDIALSNGTTTGFAQGVPPDRFTWFSVQGRNDPYPMVYGVVPAKTDMVRLLALDGKQIPSQMLPQVQSGAAQFGANFFIAGARDWPPEGVRLAAIARSGELIASVTVPNPRPQRVSAVVPSARTRARLDAMAEGEIRTLGGRVARVEVVNSTTPNAAISWLAHGQGSGSPVTVGSVWIIQIQGEDFHCSSCFGPPSAPGNNRILVVDAKSFQIISTFFGSGHEDLSQFGHVAVLRP